jgi:hypothetical protein
MTASIVQRFAAGREMRLAKSPAGIGASHNRPCGTTVSINNETQGEPMGMYIDDRGTLDVLSQLNRRFGHDETDEMQTLQHQFELFSPKRSLRHSFSALNIEPQRSQRKDWHEFLEKELPKYKSDNKHMNGHDRVVAALKENFESKTPLPVFFTTHRKSENEGVKVEVGHPTVFMPQDHVIISIPTTPRHARK